MTKGMVMVLISGSGIARKYVYIALYVVILYQGTLKTLVRKKKTTWQQLHWWQ